MGRATETDDVTVCVSPEFSEQETKTQSISKNVFVCMMEPKHIAGVHVIEQLCFPTPWTECMLENELNNPLSRYLVLLDRENPETVIAYSGYWKIFDEGHITNVAVHPNWRGQKAGTYLMLQMMQLAKAENIQDMTLEVRCSNLIAQNLYKNLGFIAEGKRSKYYEDTGEDALIMWYRANRKEKFHAADS